MSEPPAVTGGFFWYQRTRPLAGGSDWLITLGIAVAELLIHILFGCVFIAFSFAGCATGIARLRLASGRRFALLILGLRAALVFLFHLPSLF
jgi:hypothetical protein